MAFRRQVRDVERLVRQVQQERLRAPSRDELQRPAVQPVGHVPVDLELPPVDVHYGVEVRPLTLETDPVIKAGAARVVEAHVPLADERRLVPRLPQAAGERHQGVADHVQAELVVIDDAVPMGVLPREEAGAARRAEGRGDEEVAEQDALARQAVDVWRLGERVAGGAERIPALIVGDDEDDVRPASLADGGLKGRAQQHGRAAQ